MEAVMSSTTVTPSFTDPDQRQWVVEVNIAGFRILRSAEKRRHLLGINPRIVLPPQLPLRPSEAV
jgi:hypothetical protein